MARPTVPPSLSEEQIKELAKTLIKHGRANVYALTESMFGVKVGEEIFDQLEKADCFKCRRATSGNRWRRRQP